MNIRIVLALGKNREIGKNNRLLWNLPDDLKHFKRITLGKPVIMGRKTYESIGRALPERTNIVVTRNPDFDTEDAVEVSSFEAALKIAETEEPAEICIIGGAEIVKLALPYVTHLSLTFVDAEFPEADTFFPEIDWKQWQELSRQKHAADERHAYDFEFVEFEKK